MARGPRASCEAAAWHADEASLRALRRRAGAFLARSGAGNARPCQLWADALSENGWCAQAECGAASPELQWLPPCWCAPRATRRFAVSCTIRHVLRKGVFLARRHAGRAAKSLTLLDALCWGKADDRVRCRSCATCPPRAQATRTPRRRRNRGYERRLGEGQAKALYQARTKPPVGRW